MRQKTEHQPLPPSNCLVFRGTELIIPAGFDERRILEGIHADIARAAFAPEKIEYFEVPLIDRSAFLPCFALGKSAALPSGWRGIPLRSLAGGLAAEGSGSPAGEPAIATVFRACHIIQWLSDSVFCGSCGGRNTIASAELARRCPLCGRVEYPRVSPAIIVRVTNEKDEILLAHDSKFSENIYSLIAGFYEAGERLEDTVEREIFEEVGLRVKNIRYIASQSWPFPNSLMIGFSACHSGGEIRCDGVEIEDAGWFSRSNLPRLPGHGSIARFIIEQWITTLK